MDWWHTIELPDGAVTPGRLDYRGKPGERFLLPADLTGKSVLDFGTWDGYWAIEAKKRGARLVVAADRWWPMLETTRIALGAYDIPYVHSGDLDYPMTPLWERNADWEFDLVLFYGIIYHLKNPTMGLMNAAMCCKPGGVVIVESAVNQGKMEKFQDGPPMIWVIDEVHHNDPTNFVMPNTRGLVQLCRVAGLKPSEFESDKTGCRLTIKCQKP